MHVKKIILFTFLFSIWSAPLLAETTVQNQPGFFRFTYDDFSPPSMGLLGFNYYLDFTPNWYAGLGVFGATTGTQGGFFSFSIGGGYLQPIAKRFFADIGLDVAGGGGSASLVGGGLMLRPHAGFDYAFDWGRFSLYYSYIDFPSGTNMSSSQIGAGLDLFYDLAFLKTDHKTKTHFTYNEINLPEDESLTIDRNDFGITLQGYKQTANTVNKSGEPQSSTISVIGMEFDHYITENLFTWLKADGAYHGIPNGYMDVIGGAGYRLALGWYNTHLNFQFGMGAGGGGQVNSEGGLMILPQISFDIPFGNSVVARLMSGYLYAPEGQFQAYTYGGELLYHLDYVKVNRERAKLAQRNFNSHDWRVQVFDQVYYHPQRSNDPMESSMYVLGMEFDQILNPIFYIVYQAAGAYQGDSVGGYATGLVGIGLQSHPFAAERMQAFGEMLIGAAGGGGIAVAGGAIYEPVLGLNFLITPSIALQTTVSQIKALRSDLNTIAFSLGVTGQFSLLS